MNFNEPCPAPAKVITPAPVVQPPPTVVLTLSMDQAETLRRVCSRIGGRSNNTRRGHMEAISIALDAVGVPKGVGLLTGDLTFSPE